MTNSKMIFILVPKLAEVCRGQNRMKFWTKFFLKDNKIENMYWYLSLTAYFFFTCSNLKISIELFKHFSRSFSFEIDLDRTIFVKRILFVRSSATNQVSHPYRRTVLTFELTNLGLVFQRDNQRVPDFSLDLDLVEQTHLSLRRFRLTWKVKVKVVAKDRDRWRNLFGSPMFHKEQDGIVEVVM